MKTIPELRADLAAVAASIEAVLQDLGPAWSRFGARTADTISEVSESLEVVDAVTRTRGVRP